MLVVWALLGISTASALSNDPPFLTGDEFNGVDVDHAVWEPQTDRRWCASGGPWRQVASEPCNTYFTGPLYGRIGVYGYGIASFSASSDTRGFPYLWTRDGVLADNGDFVVDVRMRYSSLQPHGDGLFAKRWPTATPTGMNSPYDVGTAKCSSFGIWGDSNTGVTLYLMGSIAGVPGSATAFHEYRFQYAGGRYFIFVDGQLRMGPVRSNVLADRLWLGNPAFVDGLGTADWSDFEVDYVRFSEPSQIDTDGNGVQDGTQTWTPVGMPSSAQSDSDGDGMPDNCDPSSGQAATGPSVTADQTFGPGAGGHAVDPSGEFADPVNTATGAFVTSVTDAAVPGTGVPFSFARSYTSADTAAGPLGLGWTHSYAAALSIGIGGNVVLRGEDGQRVAYTRATDGSYSGGPGARSRLSELTGGGYELVRHDQVRYRFTAAGRLTSMEDRNGHGLALAYDGSGHLATATDSVGRVVTFTHNAAGLLTRIELPDTREVSYGYTGGRLTSVTDLGGGTTTYSYDAGGRLQSAVDQNGHTVFENTYGTDGRVIEQFDARNKRTQFLWDAATQTATSVDPRGHEWKHVYKNNVLMREIDPLGNTVRYTTDEDLNRTSVTDARGNKTTIGYDGRGNVIRVTAPAPLGYRQTYTYNLQNNLTGSTDGRSQVTSYQYDTAGNLVKVIEPDPDGAGPAGRPETTYGRQSGTGRLTSVLDPRAKTTTFTYDSGGNLSSVTTPLGFKTTMAYDLTGRMTSQVEPRGNLPGADPDDYRTTFTYDANRLLTATDPLGHATTHEYDPAGNLTERTDAKNHVTAYGYDATNRLVTVTAPDLAMTRYAYDDTGNLVMRTDAKTRATLYAYDDANRLQKITSPLGGEWTYSRDADGNVQEAVNAAGNATPLDPSDGKTSFGFDELGRLKTIDYSDSTPDVSLVYDQNSNRTSMSDGSGTVAYSYDGLDRVTSITRGADVFSYGYDQAGHITSRTYPDSTVASYAYDDDSRLQTVSSGGHATTYNYDAAANLTGTTLPSGTGISETRSYDAAGQLQTLTNTRGSTTLSSFQYTLDAVGNPTQIVTANGTRTLAYDALDRLTEICYQASCPNSSDPFIRWGHDAVGNRSSEQRPSGSTSYSYDAGDRLTQTSGPAGTTTFGYDANGNQTSAGGDTFSYDLAGRMRTAAIGGQTTTYGYDGDGTRLQASSPTATVNFLADQNFALPQPALERDAVGTVQRRYLHGLAPLALTPGAAASPSYYTRDPLGSMVGLHSSSGADQWAYDYEPFGAPRSATQIDPAAPPSPLRYTGQRLDSETALYHLRARQYSPTLGRFTATDPVAAPLGDPYVSAYVYVDDRPTVLIDPAGEFGIVGAIVGAAAGAGVYSLEVALTDKEFSARGLAAGTAGGLVAGGTAGLGARAIASFGLRRGATRAATVAGNMAAGSLGAGTQGAICGDVSPTTFASGALVGGIAQGVGNAVSPQRGFKVSTVRGLFSGRPNSKRAWGGGYVGGLTELGSNVVVGTGVNCK